jgi:hypothetical protein
VSWDSDALRKPSHVSYINVVGNWAGQIYHITKAMKFLTNLILITFSFWSCGQPRLDAINGFMIDPAIKGEAEKNFKSAGKYDEINNSNVGFQIFENDLEFEFYENDSLILSTEGKPRGILFKSFYLWEGDTLTIDGAIGLFGGGGFSIKIVDSKATVYHMLSSDDFPTYAYGEKSELIDRLEVPCNDTKAIVSEIPIKGAGKIIYGYVEFKSEDYYSSQGTVDGKELDPRKKSRANMKMYFKSGELKL